MKGSALTALEDGDAAIGSDAIKELMSQVDAYIPQPERPKDQPFLMPIEDVFSISGRGTVVTGRIERGIVNVGEEIEIVGLKDTVKTTCTGVEMFRKLLDEGQAGDNVGVLLRGTKREDVERGQVLAKPSSITLAAAGAAGAAGARRVGGRAAEAGFGRRRAGGCAAARRVRSRPQLARGHAG